VRNDVPEKNETNIDEGAMCEVLIDGHFGYAATADLSKAGLRCAFDTAIATTRAGSRYKVHAFTDAQRRAVQGAYESPTLSKLSETPLSLMTDCLLAASKAMANRLLLDQRHKYEPKL
jgi:predicted Zn-dependent protease